MAVKSSGSPLALGGSRKKGVEATQTASGIDITGTDICEEFGHTGSNQAVNGVNIALSAYHKGSGGLVPDTSSNASVANSTTAQKRFNNYYGSQNTFFDSTFTMDSLNGAPGRLNFSQSVLASTGFPEAFAIVKFSRLTSGTYANSIRVQYQSGTSAQYATEYNIYLNFSPDLANSAWYVKYNYINNSNDASVTGDARPTGGCHSHYQYSLGPRPSDDNLSPGGWHRCDTSNNFKNFTWKAMANANFAPGCTNSAAVGTSWPSGQGTNTTNHAYPFQIAIQLPGQAYGSGPDSSSFLRCNCIDSFGAGFLQATKGTVQAPLPPGGP